MVRHISRRSILQAAAFSLAAPRLVFAQEEYSGQYIDAKKVSSPLLGSGGASTEHWRLTTNHESKGHGISILRAKQGQEVRIRLMNHLDENVWLHFFGVRGPSDMMSVNMEPGDGNSVEVVFTPPDAGTFWFGPALKASKQRAMGLYGLLIVDEALPTVSSFEQPMIFEDWKLDDSGKIVQGFGDIEQAAGEGRIGNWMTVNGRLKPRIKLAADKPARLRLFNAANARDLKIMFKGATLVLLALDGQPVKPSEITFSDITLAPGQRADVLVKDAIAEVPVMIDLGEDSLEAAFLEVPRASLKSVAGSTALPGNPVPVVDPADAVRSIELMIEGGLKGGLKSAKVGDQQLDLRGLLEKGVAWAVNGVVGPSATALFEAKPGEVLILVIFNRTRFAQPLHVHGHVWHLLEEGSQVMENQSWRDTAVVPPQTVSKLAMVAGTEGTWAIQSLVAERGDSGLFATFKIVT
jgi:FtsP/CotA-like multicopper oxidase with cupredoxin domain